MSCWLCGNRTLSLVVDVIKSDDFKDYDTNNYAQKTNKELMDKLSELNTWSLDCRYGKSEDNKLDNINYKNMTVSPAQRHKSVRCYIYQTCEGIGNEDDPLYKALDQWSQDTYPKYEAEEDECYWDIDNPI